MGNIKRYLLWNFWAELKERYVCGPLLKLFIKVIRCQTLVAMATESEKNENKHFSETPGAVWTLLGKMFLGWLSMKIMILIARREKRSRHWTGVIFVLCLYGKIHTIFHLKTLSQIRRNLTVFWVVLYWTSLKKVNPCQPFVVTATERKHFKSCSLSIFGQPSVFVMKSCNQWKKTWPTGAGGDIFGWLSTDKSDIPFAHFSGGRPIAICSSYWNHSPGSTSPLYQCLLQFRQTATVSPEVFFYNFLWVLTFDVHYIVFFISI